MSTRAKARAKTVLATLPAKKVTVRSPETSLGAQRAKIKEAGFFDAGGQIAFTDAGHELDRPLLEIAETRRGLGSDFPGILAPSNFAASISSCGKVR